MKYSHIGLHGVLAKTVLAKHQKKRIRLFKPTNVLLLLTVLAKHQTKRIRLFKPTNVLLLQYIVLSDHVSNPSMG